MIQEAGMNKSFSPDAIYSGENFRPTEVSFLWPYVTPISLLFQYSSINTFDKY